MTAAKAFWNACGLVDIAMQRARHVAPVEHALFAGNQRQNLFRLLPDQLGVALRRLGVEPRPRHVEAAPLHLRGVHAHMLGRLDLQPALLMRAMVDPHVQPRPRQLRVGGLLPRLTNLAKLNLRTRLAARGKPFVLTLDQRLVAKPLGLDRANRHHHMRMMVTNVVSPCGAWIAKSTAAP